MLKDVKFIEELPNLCARLDTASAYDVTCKSIPELLYYLLNKLNCVIVNYQHNDEVILEEVKALRDKVEALLAGGLDDEVRKLLEEMYADGRLTALVGEALVDINRKLDNALEQVENEKKKYGRYCTVSATSFPHFKLEDNPRHFISMKRQNIDLTYCDMVGVKNLTDIALDYNIPAFEQSIVNIQKEGIKIKMLKPHIGVDFRDDTYRPNYKPTNIQGFFTNWYNCLLEYAKLCDKHGIPILCISCEMDYLVTDDKVAYWRQIEGDLKAQFPNLLLTHSFTSAFWGQRTQERLIYSTGDFIGLNVYLSLTNIKSGDLEVTQVEDMIAQDLWGVQTCKIASNISRAYNKKILITETGCIDTDMALFSATGGTKDNHRSQYLFHNMMIQGVYKMEEVVGFALWHIDDPWRYYEIDSVTSAEKSITQYIESVTKL